MVAVPTAWSQTSSLSLSIGRGTDELRVSWVGRGTLQTGTSPQGPWQDLLEASNPVRVQPAASQQFFRGLSRYGTRAELIEANSEWRSRS